MHASGKWQTTACVRVDFTVYALWWCRARIAHMRSGATEHALCLNTRQLHQISPRSEFRRQSCHENMLTYVTIRMVHLFCDTECLYNTPPTPGNHTKFHCSIYSRRRMLVPYSSPRNTRLFNKSLSSMFERAMETMLSRCCRARWLRMWSKAVWPVWHPIARLTRLVCAVWHQSG